MRGTLEDFGRWLYNLEQGWHRLQTEQLSRRMRRYAKEVCEHGGPQSKHIGFLIMSKLVFAIEQNDSNSRCDAKAKLYELISFVVRLLRKAGKLECGEGLPHLFSKKKAATGP